MNDGLCPQLLIRSLPIRQVGAAFKVYDLCDDAFAEGKDFKLLTLE